MEGTFELTVWLPASTEEGLALMKRVVVLHEKDFTGFPDESAPKSFASVLLGERPFLGGPTKPLPGRTVLVSP